jgi:hypothetical protein
MHREFSAQSEYMKNFARHQIISIESITEQRSANNNWSIDVHFTNHTGSFVEFIAFHFRAYDEHGQPVYNADRVLKTSERIPRDPEPQERVWLNVWRSADIARVELVNVHIMLADGSGLTLDSETIPYILDEPA